MRVHARHVPLSSTRGGRRLRSQAGAAAAVPAFPIALYVLLISYLGLVLVLFIDLLDVLAYLHVVKLTSSHFGN
jgi:hypothetical protein